MLPSVASFNVPCRRTSAWYGRCRGARIVGIRLGDAGEQSLQSPRAPSRARRRRAGARHAAWPNKPKPWSTLSCDGTHSSTADRETRSPQASRRRLPPAGRRAQSLRPTMDGRGRSAASTVHATAPRPSAPPGLPSASVNQRPMRGRHAQHRAERRRRDVTRAAAPDRRRRSACGPRIRIQRR